MCVLTGGQLGLWVGISVITMWELLDLVAQLIVYLCGGGDRKVKPGTPPQHPVTMVKPADHTSDI